jgi:hypothetical protein
MSENVTLCVDFGTAFIRAVQMQGMFYGGLLTGKAKNEYNSETPNYISFTDDGCLTGSNAQSVQVMIYCGNSDY